MAKGLGDKNRKLYLAMAERLAKPGSGTHPLVLRERTRHYGAPDLGKHLAGISFVVVGGLATRLYMPERMTLDIDVLVSAARLTEAEQALAKTGCRRLGRLTIGGSSWRLPDGSSLDVLAPAEPWVAEAVANPVQGKDGLPYIALPALVLMKLAAGRVQDLADITRMLGGAGEAELLSTRRLVRRWRRRDAEDLESMIRLGKLEYFTPGVKYHPSFVRKKMK